MIHIFAEGIHTGGGLILLEDLASSKSDVEVCVYVHHSIYRYMLKNSRSKTVCLRRFALGRFFQIWRLCGQIEEGDKVVWMNGLVSQRSKGTDIVYAQNRLLYADAWELACNNASIKTWIKWVICRLKIKKSAVHYVQTEEMVELLEKRDVKVIKRIPYYRRERVQVVAHLEKKFDFIYPADGVGHKNHMLLLKALVWLARVKGYRPSVVVTLGKRDAVLMKRIEVARRVYDLNIINIGSVGHKEVTMLMSMSQKLLYVSSIESYGLPLVEARIMGMEIVAPELDYVRSVCSPRETFDVRSAKSLGRALLRCRGDAVDIVEPLSAESCIKSIMEE